MSKALDIARQVFPDMENEGLHDLIWSRTGWPCFFDLQAHGTVENALRVQLEEYKQASSRLGENEHLCDWCNNVAIHGRYMCHECTAALSVSDENRDGEDPEGLRSEGLPARPDEGGDALTLSPKEQKGE